MHVTSAVYQVTARIGHGNDLSRYRLLSGVYQTPQHRKHSKALTLPTSRGRFVCIRGVTLFSRCKALALPTSRGRFRFERHGGFAFTLSSRLRLMLT